MFHLDCMRTHAKLDVTDKTVDISMKSFVPTCTTDGWVRASSQNETEWLHFHLQENCDSKTPGHTM